VVFLAQIGLQQGMPLIHLLDFRDLLVDLPLHHVDAVVLLNLIHLIEVPLQILLVLNLFPILLGEHLVGFSRVYFHLFGRIQASVLPLRQLDVRILSNCTHIVIVGGLQLLPGEL
jgi:hypothetical protein